MPSRATLGTVGSFLAYHRVETQSAVAQRKEEEELAAWLSKAALLPVHFNLETEFHHSRIDLLSPGFRYVCCTLISSYMLDFRICS